MNTFRLFQSLFEGCFLSVCSMMLHRFLSSTIRLAPRLSKVFVSPRIQNIAFLRRAATPRTSFTLLRRFSSEVNVVECSPPDNYRRVAMPSLSHRLKPLQHLMVLLIQWVYIVALLWSRFVQKSKKNSIVHSYQKRLKSVLTATCTCQRFDIAERCLMLLVQAVGRSFL